MNTERAPDHRDAELVLRVYELRREATMRASRDALNREFWPRGIEDVKPLLAPDHPLNAAYRQVGTYWEMVYGMVRHGIVPADYFMESNGEGRLLCAKLQPYLEELRPLVGPRAHLNAEWVSRETEPGRALMERFGARIRQRLERG